MSNIYVIENAVSLVESDAEVVLTEDTTVVSLAASEGLQQAYTTIQDAGVALPQQSILDITGTGYALVDDPSGNRTILSISSGSVDTTVFLLKASNLSDLPSAPTARTNLGLVAGGPGDIWVLRTGDTMTGNLAAPNLTSSGSVNGTTLKVTGGAAAGYILTGDATGNATWQSALSSGSGLFVLKAGDLMTGILRGYIPQDTKQNLVSTTPTGDQLAYATDTRDLLFWSGSGSWLKVLFPLTTDLANPDIGYYQDSNRWGYGETYVTDKYLSNNTIGSNVLGREGAIRVSSGVLQIYLNSTWNNVVVGFVFREDSNFGYTLEHLPIGLSYYIEIMTGNTLSLLGMNGMPIIQGYKTSMGAYPFPMVVDGGSLGYN